MLSNQELYIRIREFLLWLYEQEDVQDFNEFANGMELYIRSGSAASADPEIWLDWENITNENVSVEESFNFLEKLIELYTKKYEMPVLEQVLHFLMPGHIFYNEQYAQKWEEIVSK